MQVDAVTMSRKDRERLQRKSEIIKAAAQLFAKKGFKNTTLEEIASKAEFGTGTIYNYFQSKNEIYKAIIDSSFDTILEIFSQCTKETDNLIDFLKNYTRKVFEYYAQNTESLIIIVSFYTAIGEGPVNLRKETFDIKNAELDELLKKKIREGIKNKEIRKINPDNFYQFYNNLLFPYIANLVYTDKLNESEVNKHVNFILDIIFNGILER